MNLLDYPRPKGDTGVGFHWFPDHYHYEKRYFDIFVPELKAMGASWLLVLSDGLNTIPDWFLRGLMEHDIEPIIRIYTQFVTFIDQAGLRQACKHYSSLGVHYVHVFNEPNLRLEWAEWSPDRLVPRFMDYLIPCLETMYSVEGIIPLFTPLAPGGDYWDTSFLKEALAILNQKGKKYLYDKMAVGIHNYAFNKPLSFGKGGSTRWTCARPFERPPGCEDHTGFYMFEWYDEIVSQRTGRRLPLIGCENGMRLGDADDPRSPAINEALHAERHAAMCQMTMSAEVPYYFFNNAFWLLAAEDDNYFVRHSWYRPNGDPRLPQSVARLKALPKIKRTLHVDVPNDIKVLMPDGSVKVMRLEQYLRGVLPQEMGPDAPEEALKAQAVAARCFSAYSVAHPRHEAQGADVCTEKHCQGWSAQTHTTTDQAVAETEDVVALHGDEVIQAFYFAFCDGHTRNSEDVWVRALPYCRSVSCVKPYPTMNGHGVGMCQQGAMAMADQGATYVDILEHYYTDVRIVGTDRTPVDLWPELRTGYAEWPRPPQDNGLGIHGGLNLSEEALAADVARAEALHVKWAMVVPNDAAELRRAALAYWDKGIMPVVRPMCLVDEDHDFVSDARVLKTKSIPVYMQVYNAPESPEQWKSRRVDMKAFASRWLEQAKALVDVDAFPGLQVNSVGDLHTVLAEGQRRGLEHLFRHSWFCCHNYGLNRTALYPYDDINQRALPVQHPEWEFAAPVDQVNRWREEGKRPGQTVYDNYQCVLGFLAYAKVFEEELGFVPPIICGEGGWKYGDLTDRRYPKVDDFLHQAHHMAMFAWFKDGVLADGSRLPEYLFAICPWILSGDDPSAWYDGPRGTRYQTVTAMAGMPRFVRGRSPVQTPAPAPQPPAQPSPSPAPRPSPAQPGEKWSMRVERRPRADGVRAIAGSFPRAGIRLDVSDPWGNSVAAISGSKTEYGPGGFEVPVWADGVFTLRFLDETFQVEVRHEVLLLTFSENENGSTEDPGDGAEAQSRLVTDWMESTIADGFLQDLTRYDGLFSMERQ
ncbi:MAG TPA: SpoIID/LytB domain-containing protein [Anaerolineae bacterium]|nr:SpoIID/LytB domain-containing protein [Anaerolineae bacterium]